MEKNVIISGQDAKTGYWYCKELPSNSTKETQLLIGELNKIYNNFNMAIKNKKENKENNNLNVKM